MITDLHAHYPMRVVTAMPDTALEQMRRAARRPTLKAKLQAFVLRVAGLLFSHRDPFDGFRITVPRLRAGGVGVALSVLYRPGDELDPEQGFGSPPEPAYFHRLLNDLDLVEADVATHPPTEIRVARNRAELDECVADGATALVHCVEGGFHLGPRDDIDQNVAALADRGVAYITVAHLFFRGVSSVAPALPFLSDEAFGCLFPAGKGGGLSELGSQLVRAMIEHRVLVDISHMDERALAETFALLDEHDPDNTLPALSSHAGYRFKDSGLDYMHDRATIERIAARDGVIGLIAAQHQIRDGLGKAKVECFQESFAVLCRHIDAIREITGSHRHVALGTDFDGFVKPTLAGMETAQDLGRVERALIDAYGQEDGGAIASGNTLRVLRRLWVDGS